jgi:hypothetical protein
LAATALGLLAALVLVRPPGASAKEGPSYILAGGELGSLAYPFTGQDEYGITRLHLDAPAMVGASPDGIAYDIYLTSGLPETVAYQEALSRPAYRYYPEAGLLHWDNFWNDPGRPETAWYGLDSLERGWLDGVVSDALALKAAGKLRERPAQAHFARIGMAAGEYTFSPLVGLGGPYAEEAPHFVIEEPLAERFADELLATLLGGPVGHSPEHGAYRLVLFVPSGGCSACGWGGPIGDYTPPMDGRPGRLWMTDSLAGRGSYYETTDGFDELVRAGAALAAGIWPPWEQTDSSAAVLDDDWLVLPRLPDGFERVTGARGHAAGELADGGRGAAPGRTSQPAATAPRREWDGAREWAWLAFLALPVGAWLVVLGRRAPRN